MLRRLFRQGFNSWNFYHCNIDENTVKAVLDAIATNGMKEAGYQYVNIDDCALPPAFADFRRVPRNLRRNLCQQREMFFVSHDKKTSVVAGWQVERFPNGTIQPDPVRFPSGMKALADYAHSKGLKFGVCTIPQQQPLPLAPFACTALPYAESAVSDTARGSKTCQGRPGAYAHELIDAKTYCDWGLDYLKNVRATDYFRRAW